MGSIFRWSEGARRALSYSPARAYTARITPARFTRNRYEGQFYTPS